MYISDLLPGFALGMLVWFLSWGFNRVYLLFKSFFN